jgi:CheY-like chemotaxis protein
VPICPERTGSGEEVTVDDSASVGGPDQLGESPGEDSAIGDDSAAAVLVIDDEPSMLRLLRMLLEADGFVVFEAMTGAIGLGLIPVAQPRAVVLDVMMPGLDGVEVCGRIAAEYPDLPVVILTGRDDRDLEERCLAAGAKRFMTKPLLPGQLTRVLNSLLGDQLDRSHGAATVD